MCFLLINLKFIYGGWRYNSTGLLKLSHFIVKKEAVYSWRGIKICNYLTVIVLVSKTCEAFYPISSTKEVSVNWVLSDLGLITKHKWTTRHFLIKVEIRIISQVNMTNKTMNWNTQLTIASIPSCSRCEMEASDLIVSEWRDLFSWCLRHRVCWYMEQEEWGKLVGIQQCPVVHSLLGSHPIQCHIYNEKQWYTNSNL